MISYEGRDHESICGKYNLSFSTLKNIKREFEFKSPSSKHQLSKRSSKVMQSSIIQQQVKDYIEGITNPFWVDDVIKFIKQKTGVVVQKHQLRSFMKSNLGLTYKKAASRPTHLDWKLVSCLKSLFWIRMIKNLKNIKAIVNLDESWLNRNTRVKYSWLPKGKHCSVTNIKFKNSLNIISAICSNGLSINVWVNGTTKSDTILKFLKVLNFKLVVWSGLKLWEWLMILDNYAVHRTKIIKEYFKNTDWKVHYNVPYWPELAPI